MMRFIEQYVVECYHNKLGYYHYYCQYWIILMDKQSRWDSTQAAPSQPVLLTFCFLVLHMGQRNQIYGGEAMFIQI